MQAKEVSSMTYKFSSRNGVDNLLLEEKHVGEIASVGNEASGECRIGFGGQTKSHDKVVLVFGQSRFPAHIFHQYSGSVYS